MSHNKSPLRNPDEVVQHIVDECCGCGAPISFLVRRGLFAPQVDTVENLMALGGGHICHECEVAVWETLNSRRAARKEGGTK